MVGSRRVGCVPGQPAGCDDVTGGSPASRTRGSGARDAARGEVFGQTQDISCEMYFDV